MIREDGTCPGPFGIRFAWSDPAVVAGFWCAAQTAGGTWTVRLFEQRPHESSGVLQAYTCVEGVRAETAKEAVERVIALWDPA